MIWRTALVALSTLAPFASSPAQTVAPDRTIVLAAGSTRMLIDPDGFRYSFADGTHPIVASQSGGGIRVADAPLTGVTASACTVSNCNFTARTADGRPVSIAVDLVPHQCTVSVRPGLASKVVFSTAGLAPSFGLGDRASSDHRDNTDLTGLVDDHLLAGRQFVRLVSNFIIFPRQGISEVLISPGVKVLHLTTAENTQGVADASAGVTMHYFFGTPHEMYALYAAVRKAAGAPLLQPKYAMFGVGWEAFGALAWNTNQQTVRDSVDHYLALGYPLRWIVIGSGFWPAQPGDLQATTSFGMFDSTRYPAPKELFQHFHEEDLKVLLGLRIAFIPTGPFAAEGVAKGYFVKEDGQPKLFRFGFPRVPAYMLNAQVPAAVDWYAALAAKWRASGVDGFKEDLFGFGRYDLRDDKLDPVNQRLMAEGYDIIERNGYLTSDGDLHRIDDFNYEQDQDRGPVNALALAYSGLPLVYPDIVGGTFSEGHFDTRETPAMARYMERNAQWASLHSSMSVGQPPWSFKDPHVGEVMLQAAKNHERLHPYLYSQAVRYVHDGFPWTMTPLPIAFPDDPATYGRENRTVRGYEWMIGDALLAAPLYGDDYATADARDPYLPAGKWMEYDTGAVLKGPRIFKGYAIPVDRTPLFIGGTGIVFEQSSSGIVARIYSIDPQAHTEFWGPDGASKSLVSLNVRDWSKLRVTDTTAQKTVPAHQIRHAAEFPLVPGHSYRVE